MLLAFPVTGLEKAEDLQITQPKNSQVRRFPTKPE